MRAVCLLLWAVLWGGCGGSSLNGCERAAVHAFECDARQAYMWNNNNKCEATDQCVATCVLAAKCEALTGADAPAMTTLTTCIDACPGSEL